jgi:hypothetical protein
MKILIDSNYIHEDDILSRIYEDSVKKFMKRAEFEICFMDICDYVYRKLSQKKQSVYDHSIYIVKEVCQKIGEDFYASVEHYCENPKNYRDIYFSIY